jgi:predicted molibdopterin-dependent oxidoreductase YjgC
MKVTIDGRPLEVGGNPTILEAARIHGLYIPSLCDHPRLDPFTACRICLVSVQGRRGSIPACATAVEEGMTVVTDSAELRSLRRGVLELLLAEHPNACLVCAEKASCTERKSTIRKVGEVTGCVLCPSDGRCELQRVVEHVGLDRIPFPSVLRNGEPRRDDPFLDRDDNLCILCGRCVRVCHEVRGASALAFLNRGSRTVVGTSLGKRLLDSGCRFCGACLDVCPTAALTERAARYERRPELRKPVLCALCGQGCVLDLGLASGRLIESRPADEGPANRGQACVKGRFILRDVVGHPRRLSAPLVRRNGKLVEATWDEAIGEAAAGLRAREDSFGLVVSAQDCCEDLWALAKLARGAFPSPLVGLAEDIVPFRALRELGAKGAGEVPLGVRFSEAAAARLFFVFEEALPLTAPILGVEVHQALRKGAKLVMIGADETCHDRCAAARVKLGPDQAGLFLLALLKVLTEDDHGRDRSSAGYAELKRSLRDLALGKLLGTLKLSEERLHRIVVYLEKRRPAGFIFGPRFAAGPWGPRNVAALWDLALLTGGTLIPVAWEANARGAVEILGTLGSSVRPALLDTAEKASGLLVSGSGLGGERKDGGFVVAAAAFLDERTALADVVLPRTVFAEQEGTWVNVEGRVQRSGPALDPAGASRPVWRIAADLAAALGAAERVPASAAEVFAELAAGVPAFGPVPAAFRSGSPAFLEEKLSGAAAFVPIPEATTVFDPAAGPALRNPDEFLGLRLDLEVKSLRIARRR